MRTLVLASCWSLLACSSPSPQIVAPTPEQAAPPEVASTETDAGPASDDEPDDSGVGHFVRYDLITTDAKGAAAFYRGLFGWELEAKEGGSIKFEGVEIGRVHLASNISTLKPGWIAYIAVAIIDDVAVDVVGNGGEIVHAATAVNGSREAIVRGPTGGAFGLREIAAGDARGELGSSAGSVYWPQLWTSDLDAALSFYQVIGEYTSEEFRFGKVRYQVFKASDETRVGVTVNTPQGQRNRWLPFVRVDDVDRAVADAKRLGAKVVTKPRDIAGIGRVASLSTPSGGVVGVIVPTATDSSTDE